MLTKIIRFWFFNRPLESSPIAKANSVLGKFVRERVERGKYEQQMSAYQRYLEQILADNPEVDHHKVWLLEHATKIYSLYRIDTKKLSKLHNHIADQCLSFCATHDTHTLPNVLLCILRYNRSKALAVFKANKGSITSNVRQYPMASLLSLLRFLKEARIDDAVIRQTSIEVLYKQLDYLNESQLAVVAGYLSGSNKYVNKDFLIKLARRIATLYKSGSLQQSFLFAILTSLSAIEVNLHTRSVYVDEMDALYDLAFPSLFTNINAIDDRNLNQLTSALRRAKYYNETMLSQLMETTFKRDIIELVDEQPKSKHSALTLSTFINIVNALAVFNYITPQFKKYVLSVLKILSFHKQDLLSPAHFSRLVWSVCVLYEPQQVASLYPLIERYLSRPDPLPLHQAMNFYYCYLYLRTAYPKIGQYRERLHRELESFTLQTQTSQVQGEAFEVLKSLGVPCLMEYNLNNLICDIMIPEWQNLKNVIIEFHGFRHFFRNAKKLTGASVLKQKIIRGEMYGYYFISLDEWLIAEDKRQFMADFIEHVNSLQGVGQKKDEVGRVSTRVRSRPRVFRLTSS